MMMTRWYIQVCMLSGERSEVSAISLSVVEDRLAVGRESGCVEVWGLIDHTLLVSLR